MKHALLTTLLLAGGVASLHADDYAYPYLSIEDTAGTTISISVDELTLTISGGELVATNSAGTRTFTLSELSQMYFSTEATTGVTPGGRTSAVVSQQECYDLQGRRVERPSKGIYVIKDTNGNSRKVALR